ncbi:MAG: glucose-1-phosphate adenylyltransferase [Desulfobulbus propionicus]|nr:MAG: glucose-1-phosphate adenylyltransferase [Desulfobulbus propionicus]
MQNQTLTFILAGGMGSRLYPLTAERAKPAVPFGGKYRILDFTLANCLHSGMRQVLVLTQYKSHSLHKHLHDGWSIFNPELGEHITPVPAQMNRCARCYEGTADAIFQNLNLLEQSECEYTLILSGDHIYRMDYAAMLTSHREKKAEVTIACTEVPIEEASAFGVMQTNNKDRVTLFEEKPEHPTPTPNDPGKALAFMGLYVFSTPFLIDALKQDQQQESSHDLSKDILPALCHDHQVYAYRFGGTQGRVTPDKYWRDVGTLDAYYSANMDLLKKTPQLDLYQPDWQIRTYQPQTPPARTVTGRSGTEGSLVNSILAGGTVISGGNVNESVIFSGTVINDQASVERSIVFNGVQVGDGARLQNCIIDKNVVVPPGETIGYDLEKDRSRFTISDKGIVVVPRGYVFG